MADGTKIEWSDATWNPVVGCTKVSPGCDHCYAEGVVNRFAGTSPAFPNRFNVVALRDDRTLLQPLRWRRPRRVFVNSLSDLFHADVPDEYLARVFAVMALSPQHTFQVLTKRHGRMRSLLSHERFPGIVALAADLLVPLERVPVSLPWPLPNVWLGVSVEDQQRADLRIPALLDTPAAVRFLSCEPLLGPVDLVRGLWQHTLGLRLDYCLRCCVPADLHGGVGGHEFVPPIGWVIAGGESGAGARPMHPSWPRALRDQCVDAGVPFHYKQWGAWRPIEPDETRFRRGSDWLVRRDGYHWPLSEPHGAEDGTEATVRRVGKRAAGRDLDGRTWDEAPT